MRHGCSRHVCAPRPSLIITRPPLPLLATDTNRLLPNVPLLPLLSAAEARLVHTMPSGLGITRSPLPLFATATSTYHCQT
jgi:hypothetical protein